MINLQLLHINVYIIQQIHHTVLQIKIQIWVYIYFFKMYPEVQEVSHVQMQTCSTVGCAIFGHHLEETGGSFCDQKLGPFLQLAHFTGIDL